MASKELSILLLAKDMASKTIGKVSKQVSGLGKAGATASRGLSNLGANLAKLGAVAAVGLGVAVKAGLSSLAELESAVSSVDGAIKQMGMTGQVTGAQVAKWANEIEASVGAAFDDKDITAAAGTLIRFGKVSEANLRPAMVVLTDMAAKSGSVESSATALGKALADPAKAAGVLKRAGVILTKQQQDQIKVMVAAGKTAQAQSFILKELSKTTKGAALASQGPYKRAMSVLADVTEDAQRALAEGFLPVLEKVAGKLSKALGDPKVMANIREFGKGLASGLDSLISIAEKLPWGAIGDSLKVAGAGAKAVLGAFVALPPWVQTAVLTGWGLNKLTGGAIGSLVGQLAGGLIKGVLGIQAGVVNVTGGVVNAPGGIGGGKGGLPAAAGAGLLATMLPAIAGAAAVAGLYWLGKQNQNAPNPVPDSNLLAAQAWGGVSPNAPGSAIKQWNDRGGVKGPGGGRGDASTADEVKRLGVQQALAARITAAGGKASADRIEAIMAKNVRATESGDTRVAGRIDSMTAAVRAIKIAPVINVSTYPQITIRNVATANRIASAVDVRKGTGGGKIYEP